MIDFIKQVLGIKPERIPVAGEYWVAKGLDDPFPKKEYTSVKILDVKEGWVRYDFGGNIFRDERLRLHSFLYCYQPVDST